MFQRSTTVWLVLMAAAVSARSVPVRGDQIDDEYLRRSRALVTSDVRGHLELAKWCKKNTRWNFVADECNLILRVEPGNAQATLLRDIARSYLKKDQRNAQSPGGVPRAGGGGGGALPRLLTDAEVQRIRRAELRRSGVEHARVKIDRKALQDFFGAMEKEGRLPYEKKDFFRLSPIEKARAMFRYGGEEFSGKVNVTTDPERMRIFGRDVMPTIAARCATVECHGGSGPSAFQMFGGRGVRGNALYTNFYVLHELKVGDLALINRNNIDESLILTYGLPPRPGESNLNHPIPIRAVFRDTDDRKYQAVYEWLRSLTIDRPDYGIDLSAAATP